jgi:hypothetical protein
MLAGKAIEGARRIDAIFAIERQINGATAEQRRALRNGQVKPLVSELEAWLHAERAGLSRHADLAKAIDSMLKRWPAFTRFLDDGRICLSNNAAKRTLCLDHLTPVQARAFMIADNRLTENSVWDDRLLAQQLKDLSLLGLDFDIEVTGFEMGEVDLRIASLDEPRDPSDDPADVLPEAPTSPVSQIGDLWRLDHHRVLCGNALDTAAFATLIGGDRAAMVFTDPPYNVEIDGHVAGLGAIHHRPFPMASGELDGPQFTGFLRAAFRNLVGFSDDGSLHYVCMDWRHVRGRPRRHGSLLTRCWRKRDSNLGPAEIAMMVFA